MGVQVAGYGLEAGRIQVSGLLGFR